MKRIDEYVAGRPKLGHARRDVAGMRPIPQWAEVASFQHALRSSVTSGLVLRGGLDDPTAAFAEDAMLLEGFADFLGDGDETYLEPSLSALQANPDFRERLRGRLWRTFVQTHLRDGGGRH